MANMLYRELDQVKLREAWEEYGREEGREEGRAEGREEGRAEGREEGRAEGREEGKTKTKLEMLDLVNSGATLDEIRKILAEETENLKIAQR
jgi:flagellar biosynthesis/type III secretory pathway protein FliH